MSAHIFSMGGHSEEHTTKCGGFRAIVYPMDLQAQITFLEKPGLCNANWYSHAPLLIAKQENNILLTLKQISLKQLAGLGSSLLFKDRRNILLNNYILLLCLHLMAKR